MIEIRKIRRVIIIVIAVMIIKIIVIITITITIMIKATNDKINDNTGQKQDIKK